MSVFEQIEEVEIMDLMTALQVVKGQVCLQHKQSQVEEGTRNDTHFEYRVRYVRHQTQCVIVVAFHYDKPIARVEDVQNNVQVVYDLSSDRNRLSKDIVFNGWALMKTAIETQNL